MVVRGGSVERRYQCGGTTVVYRSVSEGGRRYRGEDFMSVAAQVKGKAWGEVCEGECRVRMPRWGRRDGSRGVGGTGGRMSRRGCHGHRGVGEGEMTFRGVGNRGRCLAVVSGRGVMGIQGRR